ncbi:IS1096 element passenger TnpR family protein [Paraburkholderia sp. GAS448]|uniref:IS1096 element passenger TnpR family protein n=1 Tax=Paraburkholderia sp. GAS448 TaxID=3035136 RepID=UPI003D24E4D4
MSSHLSGGRVQIEGKASLAAPHHVIHVAFRWSAAHLHEIDLGGRLHGNLKQVNTGLQEDLLDELSR